MKFKTILLILIFFSNFLFAQESFSGYYQQLSSIAYKSYADSLEKNWNCPVVYNRKETQKKYAEIWNSRKTSLLESIRNDEFVKIDKINTYLNELVKKITQGSPKDFPSPIKVFFNRTSDINAYSIGSNIIVVNAGMLSYVRSEEELLLILAHELSHNTLKHSDNFMKEKAEFFTSEEYKNMLNEVKDAKYNKLTALKKVYEGFSFSRSKHSRYHETDADSLAIVYLKRSNISFNANVFLRLDSSDFVYKTPLKKPIKEYWATDLGLPYEDWWIEKKTKGLSSKKVTFNSENLLADSLKTHPDCKVRYETNKSKNSENYITKPLPASIQDKAEYVLLWYMMVNKNLQSSFYRVLLNKDKGKYIYLNDELQKTILSMLHYADLNNDKYKNLNILKKDLVCEAYYQLQNLFEQIPAQKLGECYTTIDNKIVESKLVEFKEFNKTLNTLIVKNSSIDKQAFYKTENQKNKSAIFNEFLR